MRCCGRSATSSRRMAPGGALLVTAAMPDQTVERAGYLRYRSRSFWNGAIASLGLRIVAQRPMYYWLPSGGPANKYLRYALTRLGPDALYAVDRAALALGVPQPCVGRYRFANASSDAAARLMLRIGIIGFGGAGQAHHFYFSCVAGCRVTKIFDPKPAARRRGPRGAAPATSSAPTRTASGPTSTPSSSARPTHARRYIVAALERGLHVLVEKPLTDSVEGLQAIRRAAAAAPAQVVAVVHQMRFVPLHRRIKALVTEADARRAVVPRGLLRARPDRARVRQRSLA